MRLISLSGDVDVVFGVDALPRKMSLVGLSIDIAWDTRRYLHSTRLCQMVPVDLTTAM